MRISEITSYLEQLAPPSLQESYDNSGLLIGSALTEVEKVLVCLDVTEEVIDEAVKKGCGLIIAHHPLIFSGLKRLNGISYVERTVIKAIQNNVAVYALHTNLDKVSDGVNRKIGEKLGIKKMRILSPSSGDLRKLVVYVPGEHAAAVTQAMFDAGAGHIGNYDECSFSSVGAGTFRGDESTNPFVGKPGERHTEAEERIEVILPAYRVKSVLREMIEAHPYEEDRKSVV